MSVTTTTTTTTSTSASQSLEISTMPISPLTSGRNSPESALYASTETDLMTPYLRHLSSTAPITRLSTCRADPNGSSRLNSVLDDDDDVLIRRVVRSRLTHIHLLPHLHLVQRCSQYCLPLQSRAYTIPHPELMEHHGTLFQPLCVPSPVHGP